MNLDVEDGFNFALGQWIAETTITILGLIAVFVGFALIYSIITIYNKISNRRFRK